MKNILDSQAFPNLNEHWRVVDEDGLGRGGLRKSRASRKISTSGFRIRTKQEEMKVSTIRSSLKVRMRYALTSRDSLLMTTIFSPSWTLSWVTSSIIFGYGFD